MGSERVGKVQTVNGLIEPEQMGITLMHEHIFIDFRCRFQPPEEASRITFAQAPVTEVPGVELRYDPTGNVDNLLLLDEQEAIDEVTLFKQAGGGTIVDTTTRGLGRDPLALRRVSAASGLHVSMGTGYYVYMAHPKDMDERSEDQLFEEMVRDIEVGVGDSGIKCGHIGEIGCEQQTPNEMKVVRAAARAQRATGAMLNVHQMYAFTPQGGPAIADAIEGAGGDLSRTVFSHMDGSHDDVEGCKRLLDRGITLEYDLFGSEGYIAPLDWQFPLDASRIQGIARLIADGWVEQIVIAQDICLKTMRFRYGGGGYAHILNRILPRFRKAGITEDHITTMLVDNPRRLLPFVAPRGA
jgi:phosphotriesterase-related protein